MNDKSSLELFQTLPHGRGYYWFYSTCNDTSDICFIENDGWVHYMGTEFHSPLSHFGIEDKRLVYINIPQEHYVKLSR